MENIEVDDSEAIANPHSPKSTNPQELTARKGEDNDTDKDKLVNFKADATWNDTKQKWKETTSGWLIKGGVGAEKYAKGDIGFEYHKGKSEKDIEMKSFQVTMPFEHSFVMKPHSSCTVVVVQEETEYTADIKKLRLKFPHDTRLKVRNIIGPAGEKGLAGILQEKILFKKDKDNNTIVEIDGKFKAIDIVTKVKVNPVRR